MDQTSAPILDALAEYHELNRYGFSPPGHRQGRGAAAATRKVLGESTFKADVLASGGLDDRMSRGNYLSDAEQLMAEAVGADFVFFSTCGSSLSVKAAMMAVAGGHPGGLLLGRDSHKSIVGGLIFSGLEPLWITPRWDAERHMSHPPSPEQVEKGWQDHPDAAAALIVSPSPYGTCADIEGIAEVCHRRGKPLIIDEAWGAHLPFCDDLPTWAMDAGADLCVVSVHKMGLGFEQGSVLHCQGDLVDRAKLSACADLLMTTSPSVLMYAAIDGWRRHMVLDGKRLLGDTVTLAKKLRHQLDELPGLEVLEDVLLGEEASHDLDRLQILFELAGTGRSGFQCADWLREHRRIDTGLNDHRRIALTLSIADDESTAERALEAMSAFCKAAEDLPVPPQLDLPSPSEIELETARRPRDAFFGPTETIPVSQACGRISAEQLTPYPPGIPAVVPGEVMNQPVLDYLTSGKAAGMVIPDAADSSLETIRVLQHGH